MKYQTGIRIEQIEVYPFLQKNNNTFWGYIPKRVLPYFLNKNPHFNFSFFTTRGHIDNSFISFLIMFRMMEWLNPLEYLTLHLIPSLLLFKFLLMSLFVYGYSKIIQ